MKIEPSFLKKLVTTTDPLPLLWKYMIKEVWEPKNDLDNFYKQEEKMKDFELFLVRTFGELYTKLLPEACKNEKENISSEHPIIFLDCLSVREGVLIKDFLEKKGYEVNTDYSYSSIPSATSFYKGKINLAEKKKEYKFTKINSLNSISLEGNEELIWSSFPDALFENLSEGKTVLRSIKESYKNIEQHAWKIINALDSSELEIRSDHGYVRQQGAYTFDMNESDQRKIRVLLGGRRYAASSKVEELSKGTEKFLVKGNNHYMAKGRYVWPVSGKYSTLQHGGVSLTECMTPVLTIAKK